MDKKVPQHIAIIMDGNRRWAKKRGLSFSEGHKAGIESVRKVVRHASDIGVKYLTLYAFSTENWLRKKIEVLTLFKLMNDVLEKEIPELNRNNVTLKFIGDISGLPKKLQIKIKKSFKFLEKNTGLNLIMAVNYGGRAEIIEATKRAKSINEKNIQNNLYTARIPDPDLFIRTGGEMRLSNFLLWQVAYSELYFTDTLWPDFKEKDLDKAILDYNKRERRFGR